MLTVSNELLAKYCKSEFEGHHVISCGCFSRVCMSHTHRASYLRGRAAVLGSQPDLRIRQAHSGPAARARIETEMARLFEVTKYFRGYQRAASGSLGVVPGG